MSKKIVFPLLFVGLIGGGLYYKHLQDQQKQALRDRTEKKLMNTLKLESVSPGESLSIKIEKKMQPKCWIGDADVLVEDLDNKAANDFIVTLESLVDPSKSAVAKVDLQTFYDNPSTSLKLETTAFNSNDALGLFICSNYDSSNKCYGKKVMDVMELYDKYVREEIIHVAEDKKIPFRIALFQNNMSPKIEKTISTDHIYYFQYVYINNGEIIYPTENVTKASYYKTLGKFEQRVLGLREGIKKRIKYAFKSNKALNNFSMEKEASSGLKINIPYRNTKCILGYEEAQKMNEERRKKLKQNNK
jgi:hypothetical protein